MSHDSKSPLLKKRALDALLETMTTDDYDSLGAHTRGQTEYLPEAKGTEFADRDDLVSIPTHDLVAAMPEDDLDPENAEFFKESDPKIGTTLHRRPDNRAHKNRCAEIAKAHPDWDQQQIEAQAQLVSLGVLPLESILSQFPEKHEIEPVADEKQDHEFFKEAPKTAGHRVEDTGEYDEQKEARIRRIAQETAQYYEKGVAFDPKGEYQCSGCHYMLGNKACAFVEGDINKEHGTCRYWKIADGKAPVELERKFNKKEAGYAVRNDQPFGCSRCEYGMQAKQPDTHGRDSWCEFFGMHIEPMACCAENSLHGDILFNVDNTKTAELIQITAAGQTLYHVTQTAKVPKIQKKGIIPFQESNWVKGEDGERYGEGEIFAMNNANDAVRWGARMDWEFNQGMGTGKISIISFTPGAEKWERDTSDPMSQASNKGQWLKAVGKIPAKQITGVTAITSDLVKAITQGEAVKLSADKTADVPTKSYGMGTPIGGTDNPDAGASDEPEEMLDPAETSMGMTGSLELTSEIDGNTLHVAMEKVASTHDCGWFAKSARPTDQKIELLKKQFNLTPEQIEQCIATDPSKNQTDFTAIIAKWLNRGLIKLPEDSPKIKQQLDIFDKLKKSPKFQGNKDIQSYTPETLFESVEQNQEALSKKEKTRQNVSKGSKVIVEDGDLKIFQVTDTAALQELSGGTNWCTAHNKFSKQYLSQGPSYVFFKGGTAFAQLHPPSNQLMNRQDVCMVTQIEDEGQVIAEFVDDPTAMRGLQLLAAKAPDVESWVREHAKDPSTLVEILGKKKVQEAERGNESRQMAVQHALASGQPLSPEEEKNLPKQVALPLLLKYGKKFHGGQRWIPLEKAILSSKDRAGETADYALEFLNARWTAGENKLLQSAFPTTKGGEGYEGQQNNSQAIDYALRVIKGRWPEIEAKYHVAQPSTGISWGATHYAIEVLKSAWRNTPGIQPKSDGTFNEEALVAANSKNKHLYDKTFFANELWDKFKEVYSDWGLSISDFKPEHDLWIVRVWNNLQGCVQSIGNNAADEAMDHALETEDADPGERPGQVTYNDSEKIEQVVPKLSTAAMQRIGQSLQQEEESTLQMWKQQSKVQRIDWTDDRQMMSILQTIARFAPECSVWQNFEKAFQVGGENAYWGERVNDLHYELTDAMAERNESAYTELRYGPKFDEGFGYEWKIAPVYEVLDRWGVSRMLSDGNPKDISDGMLELYVDEYPDYSDRIEGGETGDPEDLMNTWYTQGLPKNPDAPNNQQRLQFAASLLQKKKKALIEMAPSPSMLPPRDDLKGHMDQQMHDQMTKEVMKGVREPLNPKKKNRRPQINPNINPNGSSPSIVAAVEEGEQAEYFLDQLNEAGDEAKRFFMQEDYLQQIAQDDGVTMDALWDAMGDEYMAEFYGTAYHRVDDFTDKSLPEPKEAAVEEEPATFRYGPSYSYVLFQGKKIDFDDVMEAVKFAEETTRQFPGEKAIFVINEEGVITEDTYVDGQRQGETVEKFGFLADM